MSQKPAAILLCLGEASRMRPLSLSVPKVFLPFCNRPIIEYTLEQLVAHDVKTIMLVVALNDTFAERYIIWGQERGVNVVVTKRGFQFGSGGCIRDVVLRTPALHSFS